MGRSSRALHILGAALLYVCRVFDEEKVL